jgi:uncharacterized protein YhbP (UPF0306 family)
MKDVRELVDKYVRSVNMMQLGTSINNEPWVCTLYYAVDDELNLYWISLPDTKHSQTIEKNPKTSAAIPVEYEFGKPIAGLTLTGEAAHLNLSSSEGNRRILELYAKQMNREESFVDDMTSGKNPHELYVFRPKHAKLFDRINFPFEDCVKELEL